jgi:hypothetical protein
MWDQGRMKYPYSVQKSAPKLNNITDVLGKYLEPCEVKSIERVDWSRPSVARALQQESSRVHAGPCFAYEFHAVSDVQYGHATQTMSTFQTGPSPFRTIP